MANTHPNSIFRWEDAASLEHACWQCPTKANSPRALQTCYGIHSMPCTAYHPTMHAVGAAHRCSGCVTTREMHDARHREVRHSQFHEAMKQSLTASQIAELVAEYKSLESPTAATPSRTPLLERNLNTITTPTLERDVMQYGRAGRSDGFAVHADDEGRDEEDDSTSLSSYAPSATSTVNTPTRKLTKAEVRAQKKARKDAKSQSKALKNQNRHLAAITSADVEDVAHVLHGDQSDAIADGSAHPLATDKTIEDVIARNLHFVKNIQAHKQYLFKSVATGRKEYKERKRLKKRADLGEVSNDAIEMEEVVSAIMVQLGIPITVVSATTSSPSGAGSVSSNMSVRPTANAFSSGGKRASSNLSPATSLTSAPSSSKGSLAIANKMRAAIKTDLEKHENEIHARYVRAGGFWRYVGKTVFERMTDIARDLDVSSGERWDKKLAREALAWHDNAGCDENEAASE